MLSLIPLLVLAQTPFEQQLLNRIAALEARIAALASRCHDQAGLFTGGQPAAVRIHPQLHF